MKDDGMPMADDLKARIKEQFSDASAKEIIARVLIADLDKTCTLLENVFVKYGATAAAESGGVMPAAGVMKIAQALRSGHRAADPRIETIFFSALAVYLVAKQQGIPVHRSTRERTSSDMTDEQKAVFKAIEQTFQK